MNLPLMFNFQFQDSSKQAFPDGIWLNLSQLAEMYLRNSGTRLVMQDGTFYDVEGSPTFIVSKLDKEIERLMHT